jgi:putative ABC transport system permease protein
VSPQSPTTWAGRPTTGHLGFAETVRVALAGLASRRLRSGLTALGIAIGIAAMLSVVGISDASRSSLLSVLDRLGTNMLEVSPGQDIFSGKPARLPAEAEAMIGRIAPVQNVSSVAILGASVHRTDLSPSGETGGISVVATTPSLLSTLNGTMHLGRFLDAATEKYPTVVLGSVAAERLGIVDLDGSVRVWLGGRWYAVIGVLDPMPLNPEIDRAALVGSTAAAAYLDWDGAASTIYVRVRPDAIEAVRQVLAATANPEHPAEVQVSRPSDAIEARAAAATTFAGLLLGLGAVALLVGGLGVANSMLMAVLERRSEIGLRRAVGATRGHIARQFVTEAIVLAGIGGCLGVVAGTAVAAVYAGSQGWPAAVPALGIAAGIGGSLLTGITSGLYPALRAAALPPTDALRSQ